MPIMRYRILGVEVEALVNLHDRLWGRLASELVRVDVWRSPQKGVVVEVFAVTLPLQALNCILQGMPIMR